MTNLPEWLDISIFALTQVMMLVGLFGLVVPVYPGLVVMWLAALGYGVVAGFSTLGWVLFAVITLLMLVGTVVDNVFMGAGARKGGAAWSTIGLGFLAGILGTIFFPPIGGVIAAPLAVLLLEYRHHGNWDKAWQALRGLATGFGWSVVVRFAIGVLVMLLWWLWVWRG